MLHDMSMLTLITHKTDSVSVLKESCAAFEDAWLAWLGQSLLIINLKHQLSPLYRFEAEGCRYQIIPGWINPGLDLFLLYSFSSFSFYWACSEFVSRLVQLLGWVCCMTLGCVHVKIAA